MPPRRGRAPWARYWAAFPDGPHVDEALRHAARPLEVAAGYECDPDFSDPAEVAATVGRVRESLAAVRGVGKEGVVNLVERIQERCEP